MKEVLIFFVARLFAVLNRGVFCIGSLLLLFLVLYPLSSWAVSYVSDPAVGVYTSNGNDVIQAQVYQIDENGQRVRFRMRKLQGQLNGGILQLRENATNGPVLFEQNYGVVNYVTTQWYNFPQNFNSGSRDYYITIKNQVFHSGRMRITAYTFPELTDPADGAQGMNPQNFTFRWNLAQGQEQTTHYLRIRDLTNNNVVYDSSVGTRTSRTAATVGVLQGGRDYRWTVYYRNAVCQDEACSAPARVFSTMNMNAAPVLSNISLDYNNGAQHATTFTWRVRYQDADDDAPSVYQIRIRNPNSGQWWGFDMVSEGGDISNGRYYRYTAVLHGTGQYQYEFRFNDGNNHEVTSNRYQGPTTTPILDSVKLERGIWFQDEPIVPGINNIDGQFRIQNYTNAPVSLQKVVLAIHRRDNSAHVLDLRHDGNVNLNANQIYNYDFAQGTLNNPGQYKAIAKFRVNDGQDDVWYDIRPGVAGTVNPYNFNIIPDNDPPIINVIAPTVGSRWSQGTSQTITSTISDVLSSIAFTRISLYRGANEVQEIYGNLGERESYNWNIPMGLPGADDYRIKVEAWDQLNNRGEAFSRNFSIGDFVRPTVRFITNVAGVSWDAGSVHRMEWQSSDNVGVAHTTLSLEQDEVLIPSSVTRDLEGAQFIDYTIPRNLGGSNFKFKLRVWDDANNNTDVLSPSFTINSLDLSDPSISVISPSEGGEILQAGRTSPAVFRIEWNASDRGANDQPGVISQVRIYLLNNDIEVGRIASINNPQNNFYDWSMNDFLNGNLLGGNRYKVRIVARDGAGNEAEDASDFIFTIARLTVTSPAAGATWRLNRNETIQWQLEHVVSNNGVRISLTADGGNPVQIIDPTENDGSFTWSVGSGTNNRTCNQCRVNVGINIRSGPNGQEYGLWNASAIFTILDPAPPPPPPPGGDGDANSNYYLGDDVLSELSDEPVNLSTGNFYYMTKDLEIPGRGFPFVFERNYNSKDSTNRSTPLGLKWTHSYNIYLENPDVENPDADELNLFWEDGRQETYRADGNIYIPQVGVHNTLIRNGDRSFQLTTKRGLKYLFSPEGKLTSIIDRNDNAVTLQYAGNNLASVTDTVGRTIDFAYDAQGRLLSMTDPVDRIYRYAYDGNGDLVSFTNAMGDTVSYTYNDNHELLTLSDFDQNIITTNEYANGRVIRQTDALGNISLFNYDTDNRVTTLTDPLGNATLYQFDDQLRSTRVEDVLGNFEAFTYDANSNRDSVRDKNGNLTRFTYDTFGNVISRTDALGNVTDYTYNDYNQLLRQESPGETVTVYEYNEVGNLVTFTDPVVHVTTRTYNDFGQVLTKTDARGSVTTYEYDDASGVLLRMNTP